VIEIVDLDDAPVATLPYLNAARGGGTERRLLTVERARIEHARVPLTVCGHVHWDAPVARHAGGQILNVDSRVIVLIPG
jgi:hypothetical protein